MSFPESILETGRSTLATTPLRLLLIEDSPFDATMITRLLGQSGFIIDAQRVDDEAGLRRALREGAWDAVISDHHLPNLSATDALRIYRDSLLDAPFIIVSGEIAEDGAVEAMLAGADDYVRKTNLSRLQPALLRSLGAAETRRNRRQAESALLASETRLRSITGNLPGIVFQIEHQATTAEWHFLYASEGSLGLFGIAPEDLIADPTRFQLCIASDDRRRLEDGLMRAAQSMTPWCWDGLVTPADGVNPVHVALASRPRLSTHRTLLWEGVMIDISGQKKAEVALAHSREELSALTTHLEAVREKERKSIAREVHDDIGGLLIGMKFELAICRALPNLDANVATHIEIITELIESARIASDRIMHNLRPSILDQGIVAALEWQTRRFEKSYAIPCIFSSNHDRVTLAEDRCTAMFRISQEALTNVIKHAGASEVRVELFVNSSAVTLEISDNGCGLEATQLKDSQRFGLRGMRERVASLGGWIEFHGSPNSGTTVMVSLPRYARARA